MKYARESRCSTNEYVKEYQDLLGEELRVLEVDELAAKHRKPKVSTDELHANLLNAIENSEPEKNKDRKTCKYFA
eukprot:5415374-Lingulodinium_polyedra.AAC.1